jgi:hypothetical protein
LSKSSSFVWFSLILTSKSSKACFLVAYSGVACLAVISAIRAAAASWVSVPILDL